MLDQPDNGALRLLLAFDVDIPALRRQTSAVATSNPDTSADPPSDHDPAFVAAAMQPPSTPIEPAITTWLQDTIYGSQLRPEYCGGAN